MTRTLNQRRAALGLDDTEARSFTDQRVVRNHAAVDHPFGAEPFAGKVDTLMLIHGWITGFKGHSSEGQIAL